jgi:flagellin
MARANLGAMQNRLEFKVHNLNNQAENVSAAESRIRDADMAAMMTEFTRNNILFQSSTAMLAQANALPQGVLQLLG